MAAPSTSRATPERRIHHDTLYFPDGDVVLSALMDPVQEDNILIHPQQMFRVHRFLLKHNSVFFSDMFSLPAPERPNPNEVYDGVPLVPMQDSATDLASLLSALYSPAALPFKHMDPNTPFLIQGILRLAVKYTMDPLRTRILDHWAADWPRTLVEWDRLERDIAAAKVRYLNNPQGKIDGLYLDDCIPEPAIAIRIARDFGCPGVLPAAYYRAARTPADHDWTIVRQGPGWLLREGFCTVRWELLDHVDLMRIISGREYLSSEYWVVEQAVRINPDNDCGEDMCQRVRMHLTDDVLPPYQGVDPLGAIDACLQREYDLGEDEPESLCLGCREDLEATLNYKKRMIWQAWPNVLHL
ncbi:hypothetical protein B0H21DRAFT_735367 [Amylocystis lapponica]|nr:hypothetical protein B0H21DRAFT_735367 [Amylocystis lapponica]